MRYSQDDLPCGKDEPASDEPELAHLYRIWGYGTRAYSLTKFPWPPIFSCSSFIIVHLYYQFFKIIQKENYGISDTIVLFSEINKNCYFLNLYSTSPGEIKPNSLRAILSM